MSRKCSISFFNVRSQGQTPKHFRTLNILMELWTSLEVALVTSFQRTYSVHRLTLENLSEDVQVSLAMSSAGFFWLIKNSFVSLSTLELCL